MITIVLECIDRLNVYNTAAHFSEFAGEEAAESWKEIVNLLYELLGKRFTGNFKRKIFKRKTVSNYSDIFVLFVFPLNSFSNQGQPLKLCVVLRQPGLAG